MENKTAKQIINETSTMQPGDSMMFEGSGMSGKKIMDSREKRNRARSVLARRASQFLCKNAGIDWDEKGQIFITGCKNEKRNGSKYCQNCSDEHNSKK